MEATIEEVLKTIGWDSGFYLPIASDENKILEKELAHLVLRKTKASKVFDDVSKKLAQHKSHFKYVKQESKQNLAILAIYNDQTNTEKHKFKLKLAERDSTNNEVRKFQKVFDETNERVNLKKKELLRSIEKMERMKAAASWDAEAIKGWEESLKNKDEDNEILKKFAMNDQKRALQLEAKRKNLQVDVTKKKEIMDKIVNEIFNCEQVMERTGKILMQTKEERCSLAKQWQEAVRNLRQRDQDMKRVQQDIENLHDAIKQIEIKLDEENSFYARQQNNNKIVEMEIREDNKYNSKIRNDLLQIMDNISLWSSEAALKKRLLAAAAYDLKNLQNLNKETKTKIASKEAKIRLLDDEISNLESKLQNLKSKKLTSIERVKQLEEMINTADKITHDCSMDSKVLDSRIYRYQVKLNEVTDKLNLMRAEVLANENSINSTKRKIKKQNKLLMHQKRRIRDIEIKVACGEVKLGNIEGRNQLKEDIQRWNIQIKELRENYEEHKEVKNLLQNQVLSLEKETLRLNNIIADDLNLISEYKNEVQSLMLMSDGGTKQISAAKLKSQQKQVAENVLKLKVDKVGKAMSREDKEIYNLRLYKVELITTFKERQIEIQTAKEVLLAKQKNLEEERGRLKCDISLRNVKIGHLQNKFYLASSALGKDDMGQPLSMTHFRIKYAQEKYLLQQEGDELDQKVRKTEAEIIAMENTLKIVNLTNVNFKNNLLPVDDEVDAMLNNLIQTVRQKNAGLRETKKILISKQDLIKDMEEKLKILENKREDIYNDYESKKEILNKLDREEIERNDKISRADRQINASKKNISNKNLQKYDKIIIIRQLQDSNKECLHQMAHFSLENIETTPVVNKYFNDYRLELPRVRTSLSTHSSESVRTPSTPPSSSSLTVCNVSNIQLSFGDIKATKRV